MKITQTNTTLNIKQSGVMTLIIGIVVILVGIGLAIFLAIKGDSPWLWLIGLGVAVLGIALILTAKNKTITLIKDGQSVVKASRIIGGKTDEKSFMTSLATNVELETHTEYNRSTDTNGRSSTTRRPVSSIYIHLSDNSQLTLIENQSQSAPGLAIQGLNFNGLINAPLSQEAQQIATFLGVPLESTSHDASRMLAQKGSELIRGITGNSPSEPSSLAPQTQTPESSISTPEPSLSESVAQQQTVERPSVSSPAFVQPQTQTQAQQPQTAWNQPQQSPPKPFTATAAPTTQSSEQPTNYPPNQQPQ